MKHPPLKLRHACAIVALAGVTATAFAQQKPEEEPGWAK